MNPLFKRLLQLAGAGAALSTVGHHISKNSQQGTAYPQASQLNPLDVGTMAQSTPKDLIKVSLPQVEEQQSSPVPTLPPVQPSVQQIVPQGRAIPPVSSAPMSGATLSPYTGSSQYSDDDVVSISNALSGIMNKDNVFNMPTGGSAMEQFMRLQAQRANEKASRTGLYAIDPNAAFSPDQVRQQMNAADDFYDTQLSKLAMAAQNEASQSKSPSGIGSMSALANLPERLQNKIVSDVDAIMKEPAYREYITVANSVRGFDETLRRIKEQGMATATDDQSLVVLFAKALDPDSVVRETEFDVTMDFAGGKIPGILSSISGWIKNDDGTYTLNTGDSRIGFLPENGRESMRQALLDRMEGRRNTLNSFIEVRRKAAERFAGGQDLSEFYEGLVDPLYNVPSQRNVRPTGNLIINPNDASAWEALSNI